MFNSCANSFYCNFSKYFCYTTKAAATLITFTSWYIKQLIIHVSFFHPCRSTQNFDLIFANEVGMFERIAVYLHMQTLAFHQVKYWFETLQVPMCVDVNLPISR